MIYIDVNVLQYWLTSDLRFGQRAKRILAEQKDKATSSLSLWILFVLNPDNEKTIMNAIDESEIKVIPLTLSEVRDAVSLTASTKLDIEDSIHLAAMKDLGVEEIASNDKDFDRVPWIKRVF